MTRARLEQIMRLVADCEQVWKKGHYVRLNVQGSGDHEVQIHWNVNEENTRAMYYWCDAKSAWKHHTDSPYEIFDPNFDAAEARIRGLLEVYG